MSRRASRPVTQQLGCGVARESLRWGATIEVPETRFTSNTLSFCPHPRKPSMNQWFHLYSTSVLRWNFAFGRTPVKKSPPLQFSEPLLDCP